MAGRNYLIPVDAHLQGERDLDFDAVNLDFIMKQMGSPARTKPTSCSSTPAAITRSRRISRAPWTRSTSIGKGLAQVETGVGTFIAYSTQPGNVALDGKGKNSPFTAALSKHVREPGRDLTSVMIETRKGRLAATTGKQVPWDHSALTGSSTSSQPSAGNAGGRAPPGASAEPGAAARSKPRSRRAGPSRPANRRTGPSARAAASNRGGEPRRSAEDLRQAVRDRRLREQTSSHNNISMEIGKIQMQMVRRGQEQKKLSDDIATLEQKLGLPAQPAASK